MALFACGSEADCHAAVLELDQAAADGERCLLHLDGRHLGGDRGALQAQLADFLAAAPTGLVVLRRIDQMSPDLLPVLINALSEQGAFQQDGRPVATQEATFLLTSLMPSSVLDLQEDEIRFKQEAKTQLVVDFALRAADKEATKAQAAALRRRIDLVIPVGAEPAAAEPAVVEPTAEDAAGGGAQHGFEDDAAVGGVQHAGAEDDAQAGVQHAGVEDAAAYEEAVEVA